MISPPNTMARTSSVSNSNMRKTSDLTSAPPLIAPKPSVKKPPPPAPPKRSSSVSAPSSMDFCVFKFIFIYIYFLYI